MKPRKLLLSLKEGDRVVNCPNVRSCNNRGMTGTVCKIFNNLEVEIVWDNKVSPVPCKEGTFALAARTYMLRLASECHSCRHRMQHLAGGYCPETWEEVVTLEEDRNDESKH